MKYRKVGINCVIEVDKLDAFPYAISEYSKREAVSEGFKDIEMQLLKL